MKTRAGLWALLMGLLLIALVWALQASEAGSSWLLNDLQGLIPD